MFLWKHGVIPKATNNPSDGNRTHVSGSVAIVWILSAAFRALNTKWWTLFPLHPRNVRRRNLKGRWCCWRTSPVIFPQQYAGTWCFIVRVKVMLKYLDEIQIKWTNEAQTVHSYSQGDTINHVLHPSIHPSIRSRGDQMWMHKSALALTMMTPTLPQTWAEAPPAHTKPSGHGCHRIPQSPAAPATLKRSIKSQARATYPPHHTN